MATVGLLAALAAAPGVGAQEDGARGPGGDATHDHGHDHAIDDSSEVTSLPLEFTPSADERSARAARFRELLGFDTPANIEELNSEDVWRRNPTTSRFGVSLTEAEAAEVVARNDLLALADPTWSQAQLRFSDTLGPLYLDHQRGGVLVVAATDEATRQELETMFLTVVPRDKLLIESAAVSSRALREAVERISSEVARGSLSELGVNGIFADELRGEVVISIDAGSNSALVSEASVSAVASVPIRVAEGDLTGSDDSAVRGGSRFSGGGFRCTAGFAVRNGGGTEFNLTAGHCPNALKHGHQALHGNTFGIMAAHSDWAATSSLEHYDYQIQRTFLDSGNDGSVLINPHSSVLTSIGTSLAAPFSTFDSIGSMVCYYGQSRGVLCGTIDMVSFGANHSNNGVTYWNDWLRQASAVADSAGWDSGGPVYAPVSGPDIPVGIVKGHGTNNGYGDFRWTLVWDALVRANQLAWPTIYVLDAT